MILLTAALIVAQAAASPSPSPSPPGPVATVETSMGRIRIALDQEKAPISVANFAKYARAGHYAGTVFHRVMPNFMIQGGDPNTKDKAAPRGRHGSGGPGYSIPAEFNDTPHKRGILSMARSSDPNSAGSQFFICVADAPSLDRKYTAFGRVLRGMDAADKIVSSPRDGNDNPNERIDMKVRVAS